MKPRLMILSGLAFGTLSSAHADWCVKITNTATAQHLGGSQKCGFATKADAQNYGSSLGVDSSFYTVTGSDDASPGGQSGIPAKNSNLTLQQQIGGLAAQQAAINMHASPIGSAFGVGLVEGLLAPHQPSPGQLEAQREQQQRQLAAQQLNNSGIYLLRQKNYTGAINEFQQALANTPDDPIIAQNLALAKQKLKDTAVAAQNSGALGQLLGNAPAGSGSFDFGELTHSTVRSLNDSVLNLVNLDSNPNMVDLRGTTKTAVDPDLLKNDSSVTGANRPIQDAEQLKKDLDAQFDKSYNESSTEKESDQQQLRKDLNAQFDKLENNSVIKEQAERQQIDAQFDQLMLNESIEQVKKYDATPAPANSSSQPHN